MEHTYQVKAWISYGQTPLNLELTAAGDTPAMAADNFRSLLLQYKGFAAPTFATPAGKAPTPEQSERSTNGQTCPAHGKAKEGRHGLYCPTKLDNGEWCKWDPAKKAA